MPSSFHIPAVPPTSNVGRRVELYLKALAASQLPLEPAGTEIPLHGQPSNSAVRSSGRRAAYALFAGAIYFAVCILIQLKAGAAAAAFGTYPDEPAHYVSGLLVREYLSTGPFLHPYQTALSYYFHLPYFAVGYWPPVFALLEGFWSLIFGPSRAGILLLSALFGSATAWLIMYSVRQHVGSAAAFLTGLTFLLLPEVQVAVCTTMVDAPVALGTLGATCLAVAYVKKGRWTASVAFALCAAAACLTKYNAVYVCAVPFLSAVALRRWSLIHPKRYFIQPLIVLCLTVPWVLYTAPMISTGLPPFAQLPLLLRAGWFSGRFAASFGWPVWPLLLAGVGAWIFRARRWHETGVVFLVSALAAMVFLILSPVAPEARYFIPVDAAVLVWAVSGLDWISDRGHRALPAAGLALCAALSIFAQPSPAARLKTADWRDLVISVLHRQAWRESRILVAADAEGPMIAEFAMRAPDRPTYQLFRPSKLLSSSDWFGDEYICAVKSPEEVQTVLAKAGIRLAIVPSRLPADAKPHERLLFEALHNPAFWREAMESRPGAPYRLLESGPEKTR